MSSRTGNRGPLPKRWLHCPRKGGVIANRFIPFKTPLCEEFADQIDNPGLMFPPTMLLDSNPRIKLWINLTYTDRFYNREDIESRGVTFKKLACRGFGETPTEEQTSEFIRIVQAFVQKNPNDLIAVHCTHGFNRTGFLICSFLCQIDSWDINAAVAEFSRARSPGIYKEEYLKKLFELYGDPEDCPSPPVLPDWCHEEDEEADDVHDKNHRSNNQGFSRDFTNKNPAFMKGVDGVTPILEVRELFRIRQKIKAFVGYNGNGFPGAQPVSMMNANLRYLVEKKYRVSWKADGTRYMLLIEGKDQCYFADRDFSVFKIHNLTFFSAQNYPEHLQDTLLDGEMVIDDYQSQKTPRFLIYDIIVHDQTEKLGLKDFDQRLGAIEKLIIQPRNRGIQEGLIDRSKESFGVRMKGFWDISKTKDVMRMKTGHDHDGLIFQPVPDPYTPGTCPYILKWKPSELNTIDFKCRIQKTQQPGCLPETRAMLYVNGLDSPFAAMKVVKSNRDEWMKYDGKIVECECLHLESNQWKVMRERTDKSHPNAYKTAISVIESIKDKLDEPTLLSYIEQLLARQSGQSSTHHPPQQQRGMKRSSSELVPPPPKFHQ